MSCLSPVIVFVCLFVRRNSSSGKQYIENDKYKLIVQMPLDKIEIIEGLILKMLIEKCKKMKCRWSNSVEFRQTKKCRRRFSHSRTNVESFENNINSSSSSLFFFRISKFDVGLFVLAIRWCD